MFNLNIFISDSVTFRPTSMFAADIEANKEKLTEEIKGKKVCVIGGAAGVIHQVDSATTDCQPNANVEALRVFMLEK